MDNAMGGSTTQLIKSDLDTNYHLSLAPTGAQEVALSVCVSVCDICEFFTQFSLNLPLSAVPQQSFSCLSALTQIYISSISLSAFSFTSFFSDYL